MPIWFKKYLVIMGDDLKESFVQIAILSLLFCFISLWVGIAIGVAFVILGISFPSSETWAAIFNVKQK